jgi:glutamyl-tRNA synthetase
VEDLAERLLPIVRAAGFPVDRPKMLAITPLVRERMKLLRDVLTVADFFFAEELPPYETSELIPKKGDPALALAVLEQAAQTLAASEFSHNGLEAALRSAAQTLGIKAGQMFEPVRVAVCGRKTAPPLFGTLEVLGRDTCLRRVDQAIAKLKDL